MSRILTQREELGQKLRDEALTTFDAEVTRFSITDVYLISSQRAACLSLIDEYLTRFELLPIGEIKQELIKNLETANEALKKCIEYANLKLNDPGTYNTNLFIINGEVNILNALLREIIALDTQANLSFSSRKTANEKNDYSLKAIAIAYHCLNISITEENADAIVKSHTSFKSGAKLLQKRISSANDITRITGNKSADTKHLNAILAAKRLVSGKKNKKAIKTINHHLSAFTSNYNREYGK